MSANKIKFNKTEFKKFLGGLSKVSDGAILNVESDKVYAISSSEDRAMFIFAVLNTPNQFTTSLNLPSVGKLMKTMDIVEGDTVEFDVNSNNLEYIGKKVKFKYHLYADGILVPPKMTLKKIETMKYDYTFSVTKEFLASILKQSTIFKDTNKLYIYTTNGVLYWSFGDKTMVNTDVLTIESESVGFDMDETFIVNLDNVRLMAMQGADVLNFKISNIGAGTVQLQNENVELNYILSSQIK